MLTSDPHILGRMLERLDQQDRTHTNTALALKESTAHIAERLKESTAEIASELANYVRVDAEAHELIQSKLDRVLEYQNRQKGAVKMMAALVTFILTTAAAAAAYLGFK